MRWHFLVVRQRPRSEGRHAPPRFGRRVRGRTYTWRFRWARDWQARRASPSPHIEDDALNPFLLSTPHANAKAGLSDLRVHENLGQLENFGSQYLPSESGAVLSNHMRLGRVCGQPESRLLVNDRQATANSIWRSQTQWPSVSIPFWTNRI